MNAKILRSVFLAVSMCLLIAPLAAKEKSKLPETTKDGLHLERHTRHMERIKTRVAREFPVVFTKILEKGGYQVVETTGKDVLLLRPAIINLVVTAPDIMSAGMATNVVSSAGSMTLYMELYDSLTSDKIAEVLDSEEAGMNSFAQVANRVTNKVDFDLTLESWARILVKRLDEAHGKASK